MDTDGQGQGHRGAGTQRDRERDTTQTDMDMNTDMDIDNFNKQLTIYKCVESVKFSRILENQILSADTLNKFKNKRSFVKLTFSKRKISALPSINGSTDNGLFNGQRKLCPALDRSINVLML
jgi:hypothetical protein